MENDGYHELAPCAALRAHVECFWAARGASPGFDVRPDGCVDFLFDRGTDGDGARLVGAMTASLSVSPLRARDVVAVRFRPGGALPFVRAPLHEFTDGAVDLAALGAPMLDLADVGLDDAPPAARIAAIERWLLRRLPSRPDPMLAALRAAADPSFRVGAAAAALGASRQRFARSVREATGLPPKLLARILRVRRALADDRPANGAVLAQRHGFADQAHMVREVRALTGRPPTHWR
ncbi:MAG: AraC family transcriptional regulator [Planctomycetes bacterium]|nr:AraC family transcriptional regulator [Planctomycetota bacterium]